MDRLDTFETRRYPPKMMRLTAVCAVLLVGALAACRKPPEGVDRLDLGGETHGERYDARGGKLLYLQGEYPHKTYLCVFDPLTRKLSRVHLSDYRFIDADFAYLEMAGEVFAPARFKPTEDDADHVYVQNTSGNLLNFRGQGGKPAEADRLVHVSLRDGTLLKELSLAKKTSIVALGHPGWSDKIFVVLNSDDKALLKVYDPATKSAADAVPLGDFKAVAAAFPEGAQIVVLGGVDPLKTAWLETFDLKTLKPLKKTRQPAAFEELQADGARVLASYNPPGEIKTVVARVEPKDGSLRALATFDGGAESLAASDDELFAVSLDTSKKEKANDRGMAPRLITRIAGDSSPAPSAWTSRRGRLVGYDARSKKLFFAATQPADVWAIDAEASRLANAARELDRGAGAFEGWQMKLLVFMLVGSAVMAVLIRFTHFEGDEQ